VEKVFRDPTGSNAWTSTNSMVTKRFFVADGPYQGRLERIEHPDGTWDTFSYGTTNDTDLVVTRRVGEPSGSDVGNGTQAVPVSEPLGRSRSRTSPLRANGVPALLVAEDARAPVEGVGPLGWQLVSLGNRNNQVGLGCCGSGGTASIDEDGVETIHLHDVL